MIPEDLASRLENRMLLLGFNVKNESKLSKVPLELFLDWMRALPNA
jgi:hypothetical protein